MKKCEKCGTEMRLVWNIPPKGNIIIGTRYKTKSLYQCDNCKRIVVE